MADDREFFDLTSESLTSSGETTVVNEGLKEKKHEANFIADSELDSFKSTVSASTFPDDFLIINDIYLTNVPTASINISSPTDTFVAETLRTRSPIVTSKGRQDFIVNISLVFKPGEPQQVKLRRLIAEITRVPFVFIHNNKISQSLNVPEFESLIFVVEAGSIRSTTETVGVIILDLTMHLFNYKPFSKHFYFNAYLGQESFDNNSSQDTDLPIDLGEMAGYAPGEYSLSLLANKTRQDIRTAISAKSTEQNNAPVNFPSESIAWMYYADHLLETSGIPTISTSPSDYIGISVDEYQYFIPPDEAKEGQLISKWTPEGEWRTPTAPYRANYTENEIYSSTVQEKQVEALVNIGDTSSIIDKDSLATYRYNNKKIQIDSHTALWLARMVVGEGGGGASQEEISVLLWTIMNRWAYFYKGSNLYNQIRAFSQPINPKWLPGGVKYEKYKGSKFANDKTTTRRLKISSMSWDDIPKRIRNAVNSLRRGKLEYPSRLKSLKKSRVTNWGSWKLLRKKIERMSGGEGILIDGNFFFEDQGIQKGKITIDPPVNPQGQLATYPSLSQEAKEVEEYKNRKKDIYTYNTTENVNKSIYARQKWIDDLASKGWLYYSGDPKVRNIFFRTSSADISGSHFSQRQGLALKDIVCSAISLTFGNRVAPLKLASQPYYTYQFIGAANKAGQIVFTFAGADGRRSADFIKTLFYIARDNARKFGALIPEAGSINISNISFEGEQNAMLSLLGINSIIVTNIEESSSPDGVDKHQLLVEFINQEFTEESYEKRFINSLDSKKRIVKRLMNMIVSIPVPGDRDKDHYTFKPKASIAVVANHDYAFNRGGHAFEVAGDTPAWVASAAAKTSILCQEMNNKMPPVAWKTSTMSSETWIDRYNEWGAGQVFHGKVKNIPFTEQNKSAATNFALFNTTGAANPYIEDTPSYTDMYGGNFSFNGGPDTNQKHSSVFREWLDRMDLIIQEVNQNIADEENFEHYFGSIGKEMLDSLVNYTGECYADLDLPVVPGAQIKLPPEFYIYDDSTEDPLIANATAQENMEKYLNHHVSLELESIKHFMRDNLLGGSYLSKNLPRILNNRRITQETNWIDEFSFIDNYIALIKEGLSAWEPIYYKNDPSIENNAFVKDWKTRIAKGLEGGSPDQQKLKFMTNIVNLSNYLDSGRVWDDDIQTNMQDLVESLYGDAWNNISFGPNPEYANVDDTMSGSPTLPSRVNAREEAIKQVAEKAKTENRDIKLSNDMTATREGAVAIGSTVEKETIFSSDNIISDIINGVKTLELLAFPALSLLDFSVKHDLFTPAIKTAVAYSSLENLDHSNIDKYSDEDRNKAIVKTAAGFALAGRRNDVSMRRAFPAFKIYLIEDDSKDTTQSGGQVLRAFDDFYSYSSVQEIKITRSRKIASDISVIRLTNVGGKLLRHRFGEAEKLDPKFGVESEKQGIFADTEQEHPFNSMVLQDGVKIQIRLGFAANPDHLKSVFLGQIVEIQPVEDGKIIEIMCQGYGAELESVELGPLEDGPLFYSSQQVLSGAIIQDSIANFGRQSKFNRFNPAEIRHAWTGGSGYNTAQKINPFNIIESWADNKMDKLFNKYTFLNYPQDDNIFAPPPEVYTTSWERFWNNACLYRPLKQTPWQIFQEHELRHPGYISLAVPYGHSPRMTMFFGAKSQHYWSKAPSALEIYLSENAKNEMIKLRNSLPTIDNINTVKKKLNELNDTSSELALAMLKDFSIAGNPNAVAQYIAKEFGRYIPFRSYHYLDVRVIAYY